MSAYKKNILVGVTVLTALILLGWMIMRFSEAPFRWFAPEQMPITFRAATAEGLSAGSPVLYKGVPVGRITQITRGEDQRFVLLRAVVDQMPPLPANVHGEIRAPLFGSGASVSLVLHDPAGRSATAVTPAEVSLVEPAPEGRLERHMVLDAEYVGFDVAADLKQTSQELRRIGEDFRREKILAKLGRSLDILEINAELARESLQGVRDVVADPEMKKSVNEAVANFREASAPAVEISKNLEKLSATADARLEELSGSSSKLLTTTEERVDQLSRQIGDRLTQLGQAMESLQSASRKLDQGKGTAGELLNNPALYDNLLATSRQMTLLMEDFRRLIEQWEQEGVPFRLGR
jgi:ABC-type transporter Mla subunit MlaD